MTKFRGMSLAYAVAIQADGKIVAAGGTGMYTIGADDNNFAVARYNPDGSADLTFGDRGRVATQLAYAQEAHSVAIQDDGGIVAAGGTTYGGAGPVSLARYEPGGTPDIAFGEDGWVELPWSGHAYSLGVLPDGAIVVAGAANHEVILARLTSNGNLDPGFGSGGLVTTRLGHGPNVAYAMAIQPDGRILIAGRAGDALLLARYQASGDLDPTFGDGGLVTAGFRPGPDVAFALALQPDGRIIVTGRAADALLLARYEPNGSPDTGFGRRGRTFTDVSASGDMGRGVVTQANGGIVVAGTVGVDRSPSDELRGGRFAVLRYGANGTLDPSFGRGGLAATAFDDRAGIAYAVATEVDGGIVTVGSVGSNWHEQFAVARYGGVSTKWRSRRPVRR